MPSPAGAGAPPEQVHLTWGSDPATTMTVSWISPGPTPPAPSVTATPVDGGDPVAAVVGVRVFTDGPSGETVTVHHAGLRGLLPATTYRYVIDDGRGGSAAGTFATAPPGGERSRFSFTSFGDLGTPTGRRNASGATWSQSSDNAFWAVEAVVAEGAGADPPLFHLLNGDLCYANLNPGDQPAVWADFGRNIARSAAGVPWMPCLGNHEIEWGATGPDGTGTGPWNGRRGYGNYLARFTLPDNGDPRWSGHWYAFQVGTVLFISLDADDVAYQDGGAHHAPEAGDADLVTPAGPAVAAGASLYNHAYSGALVPGPDDTAVPDPDEPNAQTAWLAATLAAARSDPNVLFPGKVAVEMIVVQMHQCAVSSSAEGNGSDLGIRRAWLPLFDRHGVDLVVSGHEHNYERSHPVRGRDRASGTVVVPGPGQGPVGTPVDTRRPSVVGGPGRTGDGDGPGVVDTAAGTVFLVLGGGGTDSPTNRYGTGPDGGPLAKVITRRNLISPDGSGGWAKAPADSVEPATWSARRDLEAAGEDPGFGYGYARFDVDPGTGPGDTRITLRYHHARRAGHGRDFAGETSYELFDEVVYRHGPDPGR